MTHANIDRKLGFYGGVKSLPSLVHFPADQLGDTMEWKQDLGGSRPFIVRLIQTNCSSLASCDMSNEIQMHNLSRFTRKGQTTSIAPHPGRCVKIKWRRHRLVLRWGITWEALVLSFFYFFATCNTKQSREMYT